MKVVISTGKPHDILNKDHADCEGTYSQAYGSLQLLCTVVAIARLDRGTEFKILSSRKGGGSCRI